VPAFCRMPSGLLLSHLGYRKARDGRRIECCQLAALDEIWYPYPGGGSAGDVVLAASKGAARAHQRS